MPFLFLLLFFQTSVLAKKPATKALDVKPKNIEKKLSEGVDGSNRRELTEDELMQKFFNKKNSDVSKAKNEITQFPVFYEGMDNPLILIKSRGQIDLSGVKNLEVDAKTMFVVLDNLVDPQWVKKLEPLKEKCEQSITNENPICWITLSQVSDADVYAQFNQSLLEIRIKVLPQLRSVKIASLTHQSSAVEEVSDENSFFSSYINFNLAQNFQSDNIVYKNGREPYTVRYDSGTRMGPFLLEATGRSTEKRKEVFIDEPDVVREKTRIVYDIAAIDSRLQLGDLTYPVNSFQSYRAMAGMSLFTQTSLKSSLVTLPGGSYELNLARPSKITIYLNDKVSQVIQLPAGKHDLRDFPFVAGENKLKLVIEDDSGRSEETEYSVLINNQLLKQYEHEISYAVGAPSTEVLGVQTYDSKNITFSGFHRYGISQWLTLGVNAQVDQAQSIYGLESLFPTSVGFFSFEPAYTKNTGRSDGLGARLRWVLPEVKNDPEVSSQFTAIDAEYKDINFAELGVRNPTNATQLRLKVTHARGLAKNLNFNSSLTYNLNQQSVTTSADSYTASVGLNKKWFSGFSTNLNFQHIKSLTGSEEIATSLFLIWTPPKEKQYLTASTESSSGTTRADWTYKSKTGVGETKTHVNLLNRSNASGYGGDIEYVANRARLSASHQVLVTKEDVSTVPATPSRSVHTTSLQLGTALAFAGGHLALSRPIYDSFIIYSPLKNLKDKNVQVNPDSDGNYLYETDALGAAVVSELPSYAYSSFILKPKEITEGLALPRDHFTVKPPFRSGYAITIGTEATVYLKVKLVKEDGLPVSMVAAKAIYLDDESAEPVMIFTNRAGLVRSEGFRHGRYRLEISGDEYENTEFVIPEGAPDEYDMDNIKLKVKKNESKKNM